MTSDTSGVDRGRLDVERNRMLDNMEKVAELQQQAFDLLLGKLKQANDELEALRAKNDVSMTELFATKVDLRKCHGRLKAFEAFDPYQPDPLNGDVMWNSCIACGERREHGHEPECPWSQP